MGDKYLVPVGFGRPCREQKMYIRNGVPYCPNVHSVLCVQCWLNVILRPGGSVKNAPRQPLYIHLNLRPITDSLTVRQSDTELRSKQAEKALFSVRRGWKTFMVCSFVVHSSTVNVNTQILCCFLILNLLWAYTLFRSYGLVTLWVRLSS